MIPYDVCLFLYFESVPALICYSIQYGTLTLQDLRVRCLSRRRDHSAVSNMIAKRFIFLSLCNLSPLIMIATEGEMVDHPASTMVP